MAKLDKLEEKQPGCFLRIAGALAGIVTFLIILLALGIPLMIMWFAGLFFIFFPWWANVSLLIWVVIGLPVLGFFIGFISPKWMLTHGIGGAILALLEMLFKE